jgi:hypothetical protein
MTSWTTPEIQCDEFSAVMFASCSCECHGGAGAGSGTSEV